MGVKPPTAQIGPLFVTTQRIILLVAGAGIEPATFRLDPYLSIELSPTNVVISKEIIWIIIFYPGFIQSN